MPVRRKCEKRAGWSQFCMKWIIWESRLSDDWLGQWDIYLLRVELSIIMKAQQRYNSAHASWDTMKIMSPFWPHKVYLSCPIGVWPIDSILILQIFCMMWLLNCYCFCHLYSLVMRKLLHVWYLPVQPLKDKGKLKIYFNVHPYRVEIIREGIFQVPEATLGTPTSGQGWKWTWTIGEFPFLDPVIETLRLRITTTYKDD